jgi:hypothetical protein
MKVALTGVNRGKGSDNFKPLPICINLAIVSRTIIAKTKEEVVGIYRNNNFAYPANKFFKGSKKDWK